MNKYKRYVREVNILLTKEGHGLPGGLNGNTILKNG
jgi:hypothetical protein